LNRYLIHEQVTDVLRESERRLTQYGISSREDVAHATVRLIEMGEEMIRCKTELKAFLVSRFYHNPRVLEIVELAGRCIKGLFAFYLRSPHALPQHFATKINQGGCAPRIVCDYIAGMTDRFAYEEYTRLVKMPERSF
jgi:dGTPase